MRILIVDDNEEICRLAYRVLTPYADCDYALGGEPALVKIEKANQADNPYDCIFLDIMMPDKDGISTLKEIRASETDQALSTKTRIKVIMLTAYNDAKHVLTSFKEQADGYIVKPFDEEKLLEEMVKLGLIKQPN